MTWRGWVRGWVMGAALLAAGAARAQDAAQETREAADETEEAAQQAGQEARDAAQQASEETEETAQQVAREAEGAGGSLAATDARPLAERCEALIQGEIAGDSELRSQCTALLRSRPGEAEAGVGREGAKAGESVAAAFSSAGRELVGQGDRRPLGTRGGGDTANLLMTNPLGWFSGLGVNVTFSRALEAFEKLSWVGQARYSRTNASNGNVTAFGLGAGADLFLFGRNNEGLRLGPRLSAAFGTEDFGGTTSFGRLGLSGEIGYNFVANNGLAASVSGGVGGRIAGDSQNEQFESFTGGEFGPYLQLGLGYAW